MRAADNVIHKLTKKLDNWKNNFLSSGGRLILVNSSLSSLSTYTMGFYRFNEEAHKHMDTIRSRFFWRGANGKFKYHMMKWDDMCRPKDFGGLRVINTRVMNDCLITKWIWRINHSKNELWLRILKAKYFPRSTFRDANFHRDS